MINTYRYNYEHLPNEVKLGSFDEERNLIYSQIIKLLNSYELSSSKNWFPINNLLQKFKQIYSLTMEERQELTVMLMGKVLLIKSVAGMQNAFSLICTIIQNKQKYFKDFQVEWNVWHEFLMDKFMTNSDKSITSQTYTTQLFMQFCNFLKTIKYFFTSDVVDFAIAKFKEHLGYQDKQAAWAYLMLFVPFRSDIPQAKYEAIISVIMDPQLQLGGDKDNCRLKFILNYLRIYPDGQVPNLVPQMMRFFHGYWRVDLTQDEKNEKLVNMVLPDETLGIPSLFKIMPQLLVEMMGSSKREGYQEFMQILRSLFSMLDSITSVYSQATWDDQIFKLIKLFVGNFIFKYRRDQLLLQIIAAQEAAKYDEKLSQQMMQEVYEQFDDPNIQGFVENEDYIQELMVINPDQGYSFFMQNYPRKKEQIPISQKQKINIKNIYLLDSKAKDDFLEIIMSIMDKILYMEDPGYSTAKTILYISCFEPKLIDVFLNRMKQAINDVTVLPFVTIKSILIFLTIPILQGHNQYSIEQLRDFMEMSYKLFEVQGMTENIDALEFYCKIFMNIPIYTPEEYRALYGQENELCNFLNDFVNDIFKLIIKNFPLIKYKDVDYGFVLPNLINIFWPYICNGSDRVVENITNQIIQHIENDLSIQDLNAMGDLIDCIMFRDPYNLLKHIINVIMEKLLKKGTAKPHYLDFLIDKSIHSHYIREYEQTAGNKNSRLLWLTLLEKTLTYAGRCTQMFDKELQTIVILYLFDDEDEVFIKVSDIIHTIILTNQIIKPTQMSWKNTPAQFYQQSFIHKSPVKDLEVQWSLPSKQDWQFIFSWNDIFLFGAKEHFEKHYLTQAHEHYQVPQDFPKLIELMIFRTPPMDPKLKSQCYRMWFLIFGCFTGSSLFTPFQKQHLDMDESKPHIKLGQLQQKYMNKVCPQEYNNLRQVLGEFVIASVCYAISNGIAHDKDINDLLVTIASECVSCQILQQELQLGREFLEGCRQLNTSGQSKLYFESRIQLVIDINSFLYQRHIFLMQLQAIPMDYNNIYNYIIVLYLLGQSEFTNPSFLLPYSQETTYTLTTGIRDNYFSYLLKILDHTDPQSKISKINQSVDPSKGYKQLHDLLSGFNSAVQHMSSDINISIKLQKQLHQFITIMDYIDNQQCKNLITDSCVHHLAISYDENTVKSEGDEQERKLMIEESVQALHSQLFWKCKIIHTLSLLNNINISKEVPSGCIAAFKSLCVDDHMSLNQLGRAGIFYFLRQAKQSIYQKQQILYAQDEQLLQFDGFLQNRYLTVEQLSAVDSSYYTLQHLDDILNAQEPLYRAKMHEKYMFTKNSITKTTVNKCNDPYVQELRDFLTDKTYMRKFFDKILVDKDVTHSSEFDAFPSEVSSQEVQFMSVQGITKYVQIFFSYIYGKNRIRQSPFSATQSFFMSDFYFRLFKKIFQVCGIQAFIGTKDIIDEYALEAENKEKQRLVSCYLTALHRSLLNVGTYIQDTFNKVLSTITQEIFYDYHLAFYYMCRDQDWQWISPVYSDMLNQCEKIIGSGGFKGLRYIQLFKIFIQSQGPRAQNLQDKILYHFDQIIPKTEGDDQIWASSVYIEEYTCTLATALLQTILLPIPVEINHEDLYQVSVNFKLYYNKNILDFFNRINQFLSKWNLNQQHVKQYQELAARILEYIAIGKFDKHSWVLINFALQIVFQNNNTEIDSQDILRKFIESEYEDPSQILMIAESMTMNEAWMIRKRANWFLRDWYFRQRLEGQQFEIPPSLLNMFQDKNTQLQMQAINTLSDYLRLYNKEELQLLFEERKCDQRVYILMAMLLSRQDRNYGWTNEALTEVFEGRKRRIVKETLLQEFVGEYWKCRQDSQLVFEDTISELNVEQLREIVNPHRYFA